MIEIRPIRDGDMDYVKQNPLEVAAKYSYPNIRPDPETSYTALWDGEIVGVGGISILWEGVGEMWVILSRNAKRDGIHGIVALNAIKNKVDGMIEEFNVRRAQVVVRTDFPQALKMTEALGFKVEGILKGYCPDGCDVFMYARIT